MEKIQYYDTHGDIKSATLISTITNLGDGYVRIRLDEADEFGATVLDIQKEHVIFNQNKFDNATQ